MGTTELNLSRIEANDYNPRRTLHSETVEDLKESIETLGFDGALTVRPIGFKEGDDPADFAPDNPDQLFEVVAGSQRHEALTQLDWDGPVPVTIRYIDRETAKLHAIVENRIRSDPTPIEDALAFAGYVSVTLDDAPDGLETELVERSQGGTVCRANFGDYVEYIKAGQSPPGGAWQSPSKDSESVQKAADTIPGVSARTIENKVSLLWLSDDLRADVDNGKLPERHGTILSRLRKLGDVDAMHAAMRDLAGEGLDREALREEVDRVLTRDGENETGRGSSVSTGRIRAAAKSHRGLSEALVEASQNTEVGVLAALQNGVALDGRRTEAAFVGSDLDTGDLPDVTGAVSRPPTEPIVTHARQLVDAIEAMGDAISTDREDRLSDRHRRLETIRRRRQETADEVRENSIDHCPHCGEPTFAPNIDGRADAIKERSEGIEDDLHAVRRARRELGDVRSTVRDALVAFEDDVGRLRTLVDDPAEVDPSRFETDLKPERVATLFANVVALGDVE